MHASSARGRRRIVMLCLLAPLWIAGCAQLPPGMEPLSVTLADIRPVNIGVLEQEYAMKIRVQNPNNVDIPLAGVSFGVELNGRPFAKGVSRQDALIPAFGDVVLDVRAISTLGDVLNQINRMRDGPPQRISYRLQGKLTPAHNYSALPFDSAGSLDFAGSTGEQPK